MGINAPPPPAMGMGTPLPPGMGPRPPATPAMSLPPGSMGAIPRTPPPIGGIPPQGPGSVGGRPHPGPPPSATPTNGPPPTFQMQKMGLGPPPAMHPSMPANAPLRGAGVPQPMAPPGVTSPAAPPMPSPHHQPHYPGNPPSMGGRGAPGMPPQFGAPDNSAPGSTGVQSGAAGAQKAPLPTTSRIDPSQIPRPAVSGESLWRPPHLLPLPMTLSIHAFLCLCLKWDGRDHIDGKPKGMPVTPGRCEMQTRKHLGQSCMRPGLLGATTRRLQALPISLCEIQATAAQGACAPR